MDRVYFRQYFLEYYQERKAKYITLLGGKCTQCGSDEQLEFDHVDPALKTFSITRFLSYSDERVQEELTKCQLLCKDCHKQKTYGEKQHGTFSMYRHGYCRCNLCRAANAENSRKYRRGRSDIGESSRLENGRP